MIVTPLVLVGILFVAFIVLGMIRGFVSCALRIAGVAVAIFVIFLVLRALVM